MGGGGGGWRLEKTALMGGSKFFSINGWVGKNGGGGGWNKNGGGGILCILGFAICCFFDISICIVII